MRKFKTYFITPLHIILFLIGLFLLSFFVTLGVKSNPPHSKLSKTIIIDAGHGGIDTGTHHRNVLEKDINLAIAKKLAKSLNRGNVKVIMTRNKDKLYQDDRNKDIAYRARLVKDSSADILVSIHVNSFPSTKSFGGQTFYKPNSKESKKLASAVQEQLIEIQPKNYRKIKSAPYYILRKSNIPAIITEVGFISNPEDRNRINNPKEQTRIAQAICKGIINYFNNNLHLLPTETATLARSEDNNNLNLYYSTNYQGQEKLVSETYDLHKLKTTNKKLTTEQVATIILKKLLKGPKNNSYYKLIPKDTKILNLKVKNNIAYVNFNQAFIPIAKSGELEWLQVQSVVKTLTQLNYINKVKILINNKPLQTNHLSCNYLLN